MRTLLPLLLLSACVAPNTEQACRIVPVAQVPLRMVGRQPVLDATIEGKDVRLLLDTGSSTALLTDAAAERIGLTFRMDLPLSSQSIAGQTPVRLTYPVRIGLAGETLDPLPLLVIRSSSAVDGTNFDGFLGLRELKDYDIDVDLAKRRLTLNRPRDCAAGPSPLPGRTVTYPAPPNSFGLVFIPGRVDGRDISMLVDTGASSTVFNRDGLALTDTDLEADRELTAKTSGPNKAAVRAHRFANVQVADVIVNNGTFAIAPLPVQMAGIVGNDFWLRHRFWFSPKGRTITIQLSPAPAGPTP